MKNSRKPLTESQKQDAIRLANAFESFQAKNPKITQEDVAFACGWKTQGAVSQYLNGKIALNLKALIRLTTFMGITPESISPLLSQELDILNATQQSFPTQPKDIAEQVKQYLIEPNGAWAGGLDLWDGNTPLNDDEVALPFFREIELAAGNGRTEVMENHGAKLRFAKSTLKKKSVLPENAYCVSVSGDSMEPVLPDGSTVGVDVSNKTVKNGDMYAIDHHGSLRIKRLYTLPGGGIRLRSWNADEYPDETYAADETPNIKIIGRVFWSSALW